MLSLVKRTSGHTYESAVILNNTPSGAFRKISADAICRSDDLLTNRIFSYLMPTLYHVPDSVR